MPQITVTLDEMTYMDLVHYCAKGTKSAFVNRAVRDMLDFCGVFGGAIQAYARHGQAAASEKLQVELAVRQRNQQSLDMYSVPETENEKWMREQTELNEE